MENEKQFEPIDLTLYLNRFLKTLRWTWLPILIISLLLGGYRYFRAYRSFSPQYETKAIFSVSSGTGNTGDIFDSSVYYDASAAEQIVKTFPSLLSTDFMQDLIKAELGLSYIPGYISASSIAETSMFELRVTGSDPELICDVLRAVITAYPKASVYMLDNSQIYVVEEPQVPTTPINRFSGRNVMLGGFSRGVLCGLVVTLLLSLLNQTVSGENELRKMVNLPVVACLPQVRVKKRRKAGNVLLRASDDPGMAEAIRGLRAKVRKKLDDHKGQVVLLTSTIPGEGKTTAAVNLALALAAEGHSTVLLDADLRNQTVCRLLGKGNQTPALMDLMRRKAPPVEQCLQSVANSSLQFISGSSTRRRYYRMDHHALGRVVKELEARFDYVVIDTPPFSVVSDTAMLCRHADCVLYVVRQEYANKAHILDTILGIHQRGLPLTGCILNGVPRSRSRYGYGYGYGYGSYGYGKKYGYGRKYGYGKKKKQ